VPPALDDVAARALGLPVRGPLLTTPAAVAAALEHAGERMHGFDATEPVALDATVLAGLADTGYVSRVAAETEPPDVRSPWPRVVAAGAALLVVALLATGTWAVAHALGTQTAAAPPASSPSTGAGSDSVPTGARVPIAGVKDFDPDGNGSENPAQVRFAIDGNPDTAWHTVTYFNRPDLGGLKPGVGLLVDLGVSTEVGAVRLRLVGHGTSLELRAAAQRGAQADDYVTVAHADHVGDLVTLRPDEGPLHVRYLLIWLTELPLAPNGVDYQGGVAEIEVYRS
jgi:putative peptidoglycan lipid II flippase